MHWSIEEQTIPTTAPLTISSVNLRVDPNNTAHVLMELASDPDTYVLRFHRNGGLISAEKIAPPAPPEPEEPPPETHASHGRRR